MKQELCRRERFSCCNGMSLERVTRNDGAQRTNGTKQVMNLEVNAGFRYVLIPYPVSHPHSDRPAAGRMRIFLARTSCSRCRTDGRHDGMSCVDNLSYQYTSTSYVSCLVNCTGTRTRYGTANYRYSTVQHIAKYGVHDVYSVHVIHNRVQP